MPLLVSLPPTSIRPFKEFLNRAFVYRQRATYGSLVQIGLKKDSNGSNDYSVATFRLLRDFQGEELAQIRAYANVFKGQIKTINIQRALINEEQRANDCDYEIPESATAAPVRMEAMWSARSTATMNSCRRNCFCCGNAA